MNPSFDLTVLEQDVIQKLTTAADADQCAALILKVDRALERMRELKKLLDDALMEWIRANGDLTIGTVRYYVGDETVTTCRNVADAMRTLLELLGPGKLGECLSSNAIKYGAARSMLAEVGCPEVFEQLFLVAKKEVLKDGKPTKKLIKADQRFLRREVRDERPHPGPGDGCIAGLRRPHPRQPAARPHRQDHRRRVGAHGDGFPPTMRRTVPADLPVRHRRELTAHLLDL